MNLLEQFVNYLKNQRNKPSSLTVKNYKADIGQFMKWFEKEFNSLFNPSVITLQILEQYKKTRNLSPSSIQRHISSLRKFFNFLKENNLINFDLFYAQTNKKKAESDPWMLRNFKSFLYDYKKSNLTIKNYINDLKSFFAWLEEVSLNKYAWDITQKNLLDKVNISVINEYKQRLIASKFSPLTINRKLSSLRSYMAWAKSQKLISEYSEIQTIRQSDLPSFPSIPNQDSKFPPFRLFQKTMAGANFLFDTFFILPISVALENTQYLLWKASGKKIFTKSNVINVSPISNIKKEFYAPLNTSTHYLPRHKRIWHQIRYVRPNWYQIYHSYSFTHYLHFAILVILCSTVGFGMYDSVFTDIQKDSAVLGTADSAPPRILSFQGKLTDSSDNPISTNTNILFSIYNDQNASGAGFLWQETNSVKPDSQGVFSLLLGKNTPIPNTLFSQNATLFLGITVGNTPELSPRQQLATVPFASNSETLQGLEPITNTTRVSNVVLALDSSGNLSIAGSKAHTFQTIGGQFVLSGKILSLTTIPGSNSNIEIVPDGTGKIDLSKPIQNSTNSNNLSTVAGAVEFDDVVAILATSSAQSAFNINQTSTGNLISASASGTAKFTVESDGDGTFAGDLGVNGGDLTSSATTFNLLNSTVTTLSIGGAATTLNLGVKDGTINLKSNVNASKDLNLSALTSNGGVLYTNGSGKILQASAGSSSDCLMGGTTPSFSACQASLFNQASGTIYAGNTTMDVLFGGTATSSAKFGFIGISGTTPTATIGGNLSLAVPTTAGANTFNLLNNSTLNFQRSPGGNAGTTTVMFFANNGNVGVGTVTPGAKFDVVGGQTQIEVSTQYSQRLCHNGSDGSSTQSVLLGDCSSGGADIAEYYGSKDVTIESGDIVAADAGAIDAGLNSKAYVKKSNSSYQGSIIGIVSTNPYDSFGRTFDSGEHSFPVTLAGRIPIKISLENGPIKAGDLLTSSSIPGVGMKATQTGIIVGKALENLDYIDESKVVGYYNPDNKEYRSKTNFPDISLKPNIIKIVKIYAFANVSWYEPGAYLSNSGDFIINKDLTGYSISSQSNEALTNNKGFFEILAANIRGGLVKASEVITDSLIVTTDSIIVNGQNLKDYIADIVGGQEAIISPIFSTNQLSTDIISPLSPDSDISITLDDSQFIIHDSIHATGSAVAIIDNHGNASFSGQLSSASLQTNDATVSGTLKTNRILADSIEGLNSFIDIASYSGQFAYVQGLQADQAQFNQGLMVFGATSLYDISVAGQLAIGGTMFVTQNSIETLGTDLSLQSLRQGNLSIMGGLVYIDTEGNITTQGNLTVSGKLAVNDLVVAGDIVASGSGTFAKLNFNLIQPVLAISATEVIASSSAGVASISPYHAELTVKNILVTQESVIYITPAGTPSAQAPFLMRQIPDESFTVGVQSPTNRPIDFNWLIVN